MDKQHTKNARPNIIFIMSDDHAAHAISAYTERMEGRPIINKTPNIDRIAHEGLIADNCFCTNSICTPSRAVILTGKHSHINGVTTLFARIDNTIPNVAKALRQSGYQTAMIGKWHMGTGKKHCPSGFDYWNVLPGQGAYHNPKMIEMGEKKKLEGYATDLITDFSLDWMKKRDKDKPFFLMCHHKAPHRPWMPDEKHKDMYRDEDIPHPFTFDDDYSTREETAGHAKMGINDCFWPGDLKVDAPWWKMFSHLEPPEDISTYQLTLKEGDIKRFDSHADLKNWKYQRYIKDYLRCIASIDDNIGRMLDYLDEEGLAENTIVIYTSDQGFFLGDHGWFDKRFMYEESLRMPFVMRYPKEIKPGTVSTDMLLNLDFAETFLDYARIEIPDDMQGESFRANLVGNTPDDWRKSFYYRYWANGGQHKVYSHYGLRTEQYKLIYYYCDPLKQPGAFFSKDKHEPMWELFDLEKDPFELKNVYEESTYASIVKELTIELYAKQKEAKDLPYQGEKYLS